MQHTEHDSSMAFYREKCQEAEKELEELKRMKQIFAQKRADLIIKTVELTRQNRALEKYIAETKCNNRDLEEAQKKKKTPEKQKKIKRKSDPKEPKLWDW
jgi:hypothetical protein